MFEPDNLKDKFSITPGKAPSDSVRKVLKNMSLYTDAKLLFDVPSEIVLDSLKEMNLYQSLKTDEQRIVKIIKDEFEPYWEFLSNSNVDVIDEDTLLRCKDQSEIIKSNSDVMAIFEEAPTDFELDDYERVSGKKNGELSIGVTHAPYRRVLDAMAQDEIDLIFAGHTHGGQVRMPWFGGSRSLTTNCDLPNWRSRGLTKIDSQPYLNVSAGMGYSPFAPFRIFCPSEVSLITLTTS